MRLHARLLLSYLLLISVTLGVIVVTLLFVLGIRPAPPLSVYRQLFGNLQVGLRSLDLDDGRESPLAGATPQDLLQTLAAATEVRTLVFDISGTPRVLFDSSGVQAPGAELELRIEEGTGNALQIPGRLRRDIIAGSFSDPDGGAWLFIGMFSGREHDAAQAIVLARPQPRQTLSDALKEFGTALGSPLLQAALTGALVAVVMALIVSRTIAGPLQHIAGAARAIGRGQYDRRVPVSGPPEVQAVATAFNHMSSEVQATQQAQQDFLVNVSHDLRTPLTSIQGYSQAVIDGAAQDPVAAARVIHEEAGRLNRMVADITDLARLQNRQLALTLAQLDVNQIVETVTQRLAIVAEAQQITLTTQCSLTPTLRGDGDRLAQVLTNLLGNAIRFTPAGGTVNVSTQARADGIEIRVQDDGSGIPTEELPRIFERFYQVDKARGPGRGSGLGLAIAREIVQAHGGRIHASSEGLGKGSVFSVWLPRKGPAGNSSGQDSA